MDRGATGVVPNVGQDIGLTMVSVLLFTPTSHLSRHIFIVSIEKSASSFGQVTPTFLNLQQTCSIKKPR
jgi:hypothetical protein